MTADEYGRILALESEYRKACKDVLWNLGNPANIDFKVKKLTIELENGCDYTLYGCLEYGETIKSIVQAEWDKGNNRKKTLEELLEKIEIKNLPTDIDLL